MKHVIYDENGQIGEERDLPDPPPPPPVPKILTKLEFSILVATAGGMPSIAQAKNDPLLADFWVFFDLASSVERDHPFTQQGLAAMEAAGHVPHGVAAVIAAWPTD